MPILQKEPDLCPDDLLDRPEGHEDRQRRWWVLYTRSRREKELMRRLRGSGVAHYCPLIAHRTKSPQGRIRTAYVPLFPGYVFLFGDGDERLAALTTQCVSRWLDVPHGDELVRDLRQIRRLIESGTPLTPEARLSPGMRVRVRSGALQGLEGVVLRRDHATRLVVAVNFLQQGASIEVDELQLEEVT